jgi:hypothetical protein
MELTFGIMTRITSSNYAEMILEFSYGTTKEKGFVVDRFVANLAHPLLEVLKEEHSHLNRPGRVKSLGIL